MRSRIFLLIAYGNYCIYLPHCAVLFYTNEIIGIIAVCF